jgi:two-component system, OmpR family, KDP operon response regulator KdpE
MSTAPAATILIIDGEPQIRQTLRLVLRQEGYVSFVTADGTVAIDLLRKQTPDLILFDINMPGGDGQSICRSIRLYFDGPLVVISALDSERDKILAFDVGADDYLVKPFGMQELLARIRVLLRRFGPKPGNLIIDTKKLSIDLKARLVTKNGKRVTLTPKEFEVLRVLVLARGKPVSPQHLLQVIWGPDITQAEVLRTVVYELRRKIEPRCSQPIYIRTQPKVGYRFIPPE